MELYKIYMSVSTSIRTVSRIVAHSKSGYEEQPELRADKGEVFPARVVEAICAIREGSFHDLEVYEHSSRVFKCTGASPTQLHPLVSVENEGDAKNLTVRVRHLLQSGILGSTTRQGLRKVYGEEGMTRIGVLRLTGLEECSIFYNLHHLYAPACMVI